MPSSKRVNGRLRAECLDAHWFLGLARAQKKLEDWRAGTTMKNGLAQSATCGKGVPLFYRKRNLVERFFQQNQTLSRCRHPLRQTQRQFPRQHQARLNPHLVAI
jgi:hypothetical protein